MSILFFQWIPPANDVHTRAEETSVSFGGIIADVMGLGKTLTTLAAILYSLPEAKLFSDFYKKPLEKKAHRVRTKATLVVVPSARQWEIYALYNTYSNRI